MTYIQALRHFSTFANRLHLSQQPVQLKNLLALSSPIYRLELAMIGVYLHKIRRFMPILLWIKRKI